MESGGVLHAVPPQVPDEHLRSVYGFAVAHGAIRGFARVAAELRLGAEEVAEAVERLLECRLLREDAGSKEQFSAVDPEVAANLLVSPMEREIYHRRELIAQIRERTEHFRAAYVEDESQADARALEHVIGDLEARGFLRTAGESCASEVLVLQTALSDPADFDDLVRLCLRLRERGVRVRVACQHRSRADLSNRVKIKDLADAGVAVRTVSHVPRSAVVFDRSLAVVLGSAEGRRQATGVRDPAVVGFLLGFFDDLWETGTPVECFDSGYAEVADDLQQTIAGLMAKGFSDEVLARRLGMSVRSCRRHIASLMHDLDAVSRFQAGVQASRRSLVGTA